MEIQYLFNSLGKWIAFRRGRYIFDADGNWLGWMPSTEEGDAVTVGGRYLGTICDDDRFLFYPEKRKIENHGFPTHPATSPYAPDHPGDREPISLEDDQKDVIRD